MLYTRAVCIHYAAQTQTVRHTHLLILHTTANCPILYWSLLCITVIRFCQQLRLHCSSQVQSVNVLDKCCPVAICWSKYPPTFIAVDTTDIEVVECIGRIKDVGGSCGVTTSFSFQINTVVVLRGS